MLYAIIFIVAAIVLVYVVTLWILKESREAKGALGERIKRLTGGLTPESLLEATQSACRDQGLSPDFMVVSRGVTPVYDELRRSILREPAGSALPAGLALALAVDVDAKRLILRAIEAPKPGRIASDRNVSLAFGDINAVETVTCRFPAELAPGGDEALSIGVSGTPTVAYHMVVEPAWAVGADELAQQLHRMIFEGHRPPAAPVVVR